MTETEPNSEPNIIEPNIMEGFLQHELLRRYRGKSSGGYDEVVSRSDMSAITIVDARPFYGPELYQGRLQPSGDIDYGSLVRTDKFIENEAMYHAQFHPTFLTPPTRDQWDVSQQWYRNGTPAIEIFDTYYGGRGVKAVSHLPKGTMIPYFGLFGHKHQAIEEHKWCTFLWQRYQYYRTIRHRDIRRFYKLYTGNVEVEWASEADITTFKTKHKDIFEANYFIYRDEGYDLLPNGEDQSYSHSVNVTIAPKNKQDDVWEPYKAHAYSTDPTFQFTVDPPQDSDTARTSEHFPGMYIGSMINELSEDPFYGLFNLLFKFKREPKQFNEIDQIRLRTIATSHGGYLKWFLGGGSKRSSKTRWGPKLPFTTMDGMYNGFVGYVTEKHTIMVYPRQTDKTKTCTFITVNHRTREKQVETNQDTFLYSTRQELEQAMDAFCSDNKIDPIEFSNEEPPITVDDFYPNAHFLPTCEAILGKDSTDYFKHADARIEFPQKPVCYIMTTREVMAGEELAISYGYGPRLERSKDEKYWHCGQICYWNQDMAIVNKSVERFIVRDESLGNEGGKQKAQKDDEEQAETPPKKKHKRTPDDTNKSDFEWTDEQAYEKKQDENNQQKEEACADVQYLRMDPSLAHNLHTTLQAFWNSPTKNQNLDVFNEYYAVHQHENFDYLAAEMERLASDAKPTFIAIYTVAHMVLELYDDSRDMPDDAVQEIKDQFDSWYNKKGNNVMRMNTIGCYGGWLKAREIGTDKFTTADIEQIVEENKWDIQKELQKTKSKSWTNAHKLLLTHAAQDRFFWAYEHMEPAAFENDWFVQRMKEFAISDNLIQALDDCVKQTKKDPIGDLDVLLEMFISLPEALQNIDVTVLHQVVDKYSRNRRKCTEEQAMHVRMLVLFVQLIKAYHHRSGGHRPELIDQIVADQKSIVDHVKAALDLPEETKLLEDWSFCRGFVERGSYHAKTNDAEQLRCNVSPSTKRTIYHEFKECPIASKEQRYRLRTVWVPLNAMGKNASRLKIPACPKGRHHHQPGDIIVFGPDVSHEGTRSKTNKAPRYNLEFRLLLPRFTLRVQSYDTIVQDNVLRVQLHTILSANSKALGFSLNQLNLEGQWFLAMENTLLVGACMLVRHEKNQWWLYNMAVARNFKRQGIGTFLIESVFNSNTLDGAPLYLIPSDSATDFYDKMIQRGFDIRVQQPSPEPPTPKTGQHASSTVKRGTRRRSHRSTVPREFKTKVKELIANIPKQGRVVADLTSLPNWKTDPGRIKYVFDQLPARVELLNGSGGETMTWGSDEVDALIVYLRDSHVYYINLGETQFKRNVLSNQLYPALVDTYVGFVFFSDTMVNTDELNGFFRKTGPNNVLAQNRQKTPEWYDANIFDITNASRVLQNPLFRISPWYDAKAHDDAFTKLMGKAFHGSHNSTYVYKSMKKWIREEISEPDGSGGWFYNESTATGMDEDGFKSGFWWPNNADVLYYEGVFENGVLINGFVVRSDNTWATVAQGQEQETLVAGQKQRDKSLNWYFEKLKNYYALTPSIQPPEWVESFKATRTRLEKKMKRKKRKRR